MHPELVSIIIPCYNAEKYLNQAVDSALAQTYPHCEVIVIDDGSTDGSLEILKKYHQLIRWETGPNQGGCAARNRGLEIANGEWIQFLDADDMLHPEKIATHLSLAQKHDAFVINSLVYLLKEEEKEPWAFLPAPDFPDYELSGIEFCIHKRLEEIEKFIEKHNTSEFHAKIRHSYPQCWLFHRSILDKAGRWDEELIICQDIEYFDRILLHTPKVYFSGKVLSIYRYDLPGSVSKGVSKKHMESRMRYLKSASNILKIRSDEPVRVGLARLYLHLIIRCIPYHWGIIHYCAKQIKKLKIPRGAEASTPRMKKLCKYFGPIIASLLLRVIKGKKFIIP